MMRFSTFVAARDSALRLLLFVLLAPCALPAAPAPPTTTERLQALGKDDDLRLGEIAPADVRHSLALATKTASSTLRLRPRMLVISR